MMEPNNAIQALCRSAATSYSGNLTPESLLAFLRDGVVDDDSKVQLAYAIEEVPADLWQKAIRDFQESDRAQMRRTISEYAKFHRLHLPAEMVEWLSG